MTKSFLKFAFLFICKVPKKLAEGKQLNFHSWTNSFMHFGTFLFQLFEESRSHLTAQHMIPTYVFIPIRF